MKETIGKRIRKIREGKDFSQENIAAELNMTTSAYSKIERGVTDASTSKLIKIAEILEVDVADFFIDVKNTSKKSNEPMQVFGFATKGDIEEIVKMIQEVVKEVNQLKITLNSPSANIPKKSRGKK
ncbi:MAG: helix-turn-helix transcriptional regulator [Bacteroidia bacterium]